MRKRRDWQRIINPRGQFKILAKLRCGEKLKIKSFNR